MVMDEDFSRSPPGCGRNKLPPGGGTVQLSSAKSVTGAPLAAGDVAVGNPDDGGVQAVKGVQHHLAAPGPNRADSAATAGSKLADQMALFIGQCAGVAQGAASSWGHPVNVG